MKHKIRKRVNRQREKIMAFQLLSSLFSSAPATANVSSNSQTSQKHALLWNGECLSILPSNAEAIEVHFTVHLLPGTDTTSVYVLMDTPGPFVVDVQPACKRLYALQEGSRVWVFSSLSHLLRFAWYQYVKYHVGKDVYCECCHQTDGAIICTLEAMTCLATHRELCFRRASSDEIHWSIVSCDIAE
jgi:hypothetical protein